MESNSALLPDNLRAAVRHHYADLVTSGQREETSCCCAPTSCCEPGSAVDQASQALGYSAQELQSVPTGANLGAGCGNPVGLASLRPGQVVLDLGSGAGLDCFLAAQQVGESGKVIGVDMTPEMIARARENARRSGIKQVEYRLGEIECLPVETSTVDVILSNCVINLSPEKERVLAECVRVLRPGGRLAISDVVLTAELPESARGDLKLYSACATGAWTIQRWQEALQQLGFAEVRVTPKDASREFIRSWSDKVPLENFILSADIAATRPN